LVPRNSSPYDNADTVPVTGNTQSPHRILFEGYPSDFGCNDTVCCSACDARSIKRRAARCHHSERRTRYKARRDNHR